MPSSGATRHVAARPAPSEGERELKFTFPDARAHVVRRWIESTCRRDPEFPAAIVWTVYYDTPALVSLGEKINSDFLKHKIRVRWYSDLNGSVSGPAFVEAKLRVGTRRLKVRERLPYPAEEIARWELQDPRFRGLPHVAAGTRCAGPGCMAADDADSLSPRSVRRDAEPVSRQPRCRHRGRRGQRARFSLAAICRRSELPCSK